MKRAMPFILVLVLLCGVLSGCKSKEEENVSSEGSVSSGSVELSATDEDMFTERDQRTEYSENDAITIKLTGNSASASSDSVKIEGSRITITENKMHIISGSLNDGMIIVNAEDTAKLQLVLDGVNINSESSAPLYILSADKVFITLPEGSENHLSNGGVFSAIDENNIDGALYSKQDITINGKGSLSVSSPAGHGIVAKDDLVFTGGDLTVTSASHGLDVNDSVRVTGETKIKIEAGKDGIHAENTDEAALGFIYFSGGEINIEAEGDGVSAGSYMQILDGTVNVTAGGGSENGSKASSDNWGDFGGMGGGPGGMGMRPGRTALTAETTDTDDSSTSMKGLKAVSDISISGGKITIDSADDSVHSDSSLKISGGSFNISSGDDACHAEDTLTVTDGDIDITESYEGLEALHINVSGGDIKLVASDDGLNAAGGTDSSGTTGGRDGMFDGMGKGPGGMGGMGGMSLSSNGSIVISGGTLYINSSGDGLDANGTLEISGGHTTVVGPTQGDTATLDYDKSGIITGGTFIGTGASGMAQSFSGSEQGVIAVSVGSQTAKTTITLTDSKGKEIISYAPELSFQVVILSSPDIKSGDSYTITVGSVSGEFKAN